MPRKLAAPNWLDRFGARWFKRRWGKHFDNDPRLLAIHILQFDKLVHPKLRQDDDALQYYEER